MSRVGLIGLGLMGTPMAVRLVEAGHDVAVTSRRHDPRNAAVVAGAQWHDSPSDLADREIVVTMLPEASDVDHVLFGAEGLFSGTSGPGIVVDMSTIGPDAAARIAAEVVARGARFADAPVSGGPAGAASGSLAIMVGAGPTDFERLAPLLSVLGTPRRLGPVSSGQTAKLANQALIAGIMGGIADAFSLATGRGLSISDLHEAVRVGFGGSPLLDFVAGRVAVGDDAPGFKIAHMTKDLDLVAEAADASASDARVAALVRRLFDELGPDARPLGTQRLPSSRIRQPSPDTDHGERR